MLKRRIVLPPVHLYPADERILLGYQTTRAG